MSIYEDYKNIYCNLDLDVPAYAKKFEDYYNKRNHNPLTRLCVTDQLDFDLPEEEFNMYRPAEEEVSFTPLRWGDEVELGVYGVGVLHDEWDGQDIYGGPCDFVFLMEDGKFRVFCYDDIMEPPKEFGKGYSNETGDEVEYELG